MKRIFPSLLTLLLIVSLLASCAPQDVSTDDESSKAAVSEKNDGSESSGASEMNNEKQPIKLTSMSSGVKYVPSSTSVEEITEDECELLAVDMYADVLSIMCEFYGFPDYLCGTNGPHKAGEIVYSKVEFRPDTKIQSTIVFENDAEKLREILDTYLTDDFQELAFSLKYPCPIYEEDGVLYRTGYETGNGMRGMDFAAGRIISREDGVVRYAFPMYYLDFETNEPKSQHTYMGYMDFAYEDGKWKVDDCYLSYTKYSYDYYPGGQSVIYAEVLDDLEDELVFDGISVLLSEDDKAVMEYEGKTIDLPIKNPTNKIRKIEKANGNIFISFLGVFEEIETVVVSESTLEIAGSFVSNGYCITEDGWNYVVIERATQSYLIKDKNGELICDCAAVKQEYADDFCLPHIAPIKSVVKTDEGYEISYDTFAYYNE